LPPTTTFAATAWNISIAPFVKEVSDVEAKNLEPIFVAGEGPLCLETALLAQMHFTPDYV
jgi:hypothetical protein